MYQFKLTVKIFTQIREDSYVIVDKKSVNIIHYNYLVIIDM